MTEVFFEDLALAAKGFALIEFMQKVLELSRTDQV